MILRTAGAAVSAPNPPDSKVATTTYLGFGYGARPTYQDWSARPAPFWAVPVLPATGIGKPLNTGNEVPPGEPAATRRPWRIAWRKLAWMLRCLRGGDRNSWITRPVLSSTRSPR